LKASKYLAVKRDIVSNYNNPQELKYECKSLREEFWQQIVTKITQNKQERVWPLCS
jgi:hypothetical protein